MQILGLRSPLTVAQEYLAYGFMLKRGVTEIDVRNEPFLRRQLEQLAPKPAPSIAPWVSPRGAA